MILRRCTLICSLGLLPACGADPPDFEYATANLNIATTFDAPLCLGTVKAADLEAQRIKSLLDPSAEPIDLYLGIDGVLDHCPPNSNGCSGHGGPIFTDMPSLPHELVHAYGKPTDLPFLDEGLAEALSGGQWTLYSTSVTDFATISLAELLVSDRPQDSSETDQYYSIAGHFTTWLIDEHGLDSLLRWRAELPPGSDLAAVESAFVDVYGYSLATAEMRWKTLAPSEYRIGLGVCGGDAVPWTNQDAWSATFVLDCADESTRGPWGHGSSIEPNMRQSVVLDIAHQGEYRLHTQATRPARVALRPCACWETWFNTEGPSVDVPEGSSEHSVELDMCRYALTVVVDDVETTSVEVRLEPEALDP